MAMIAQGEPYAIAEASRRGAGFTGLVKDSEKTLGIPGGMTVPLTWAAVVQAQAQYGPQTPGGPSHWHPYGALLPWIEREITSRTIQPPRLYVEPPAGLKPRSYQVSGAAAYRETGGGLLWDDPGTGKTVTALLGLIERAAAGHRVLPILVVCPASVVDVWVDHVRQWAPFWRVQAWRGSPGRRRRLLHTADIYVCSYGTLRRDAEDTDPRHSPLIALSANTLVADEVHMIKASESAQSRAARRVADRGVEFLGMSGTPITHNPGDIWPALHCLAPLAYPSKDRWIQRYCNYDKKDYSLEATSFNHREEEYRLTLRGQERRVSKLDVAKELPPKTYTVRYVDIPTRWRKAYDAMQEFLLAELPDGGHLPAIATMDKMTRLLQLACSAADVEITKEWIDDPVEGPIEKQHVHVTLREPSWKVDELLSIMEERPGRPCVAFAPSEQLMRLAAVRAESKGYRVGFITGPTSMKKRTLYREAFQRGELDLIACTTGAGGVGITLTRGDLLVFLQRPWGLVPGTQAEDRVHRLGSEIHERIEIIDIVTRDSIESRVREILKTRAGSLSDFVRDPRIVATMLGGASVTRINGRKSA